MEGIAPARLTPTEGRRFGYTVGAAFLALAAVLWWRGRNNGALVAAAIGGVLILAALLAPGGLGPVYRAWMGLARIISRVTTPVFLGAVYFLLITSVGLVLRVLGKDPLARATAGGTWRTRNSPADRRSDLKRQF